MKRQEKIFTVQNLAEKLKEAKSIILVDYRGLTVPQLNQLRNLVKRSGGELTVVKNTLLGRSLSRLQLPTANLQLIGPTAIILTYKDELAPIKTVFEFAKTSSLPVFKSGIWEDRVLTKEEIERLGSLSSREELINTLVNLFSFPLQHLLGILSVNPQKLILILKTKPSFAEATKGKGGEN